MPRRLALTSLAFLFLTAAPVAAGDAPGWLVGEWTSFKCELYKGRDLTVTADGFTLLRLGRNISGDNSRTNLENVTVRSSRSVGFQMNGNRFLLLNKSKDGLLFEKLGADKIKLVNFLAKGNHVSHEIDGTEYSKCSGKAKRRYLREDVE